MSGSAVLCVHILTNHCKYSNQDTMFLSLFYLSNCPLPIKDNPFVGTQLLMRCGVAVRSILKKREKFESTEMQDISGTLCYIHTCLSHRLESLQIMSYEDKSSEEAHTFDTTRLHTITILGILQQLEDLHMVSISFAKRQDLYGLYHSIIRKSLLCMG